MMKFRVANEKALMSALKRSRNEIALLVGSPLSAAATSTDKGVPSVSGILEIIEHYLDDEPELKEEYIQEVINKHSNDTDRYQKAFEFLADYTDPETLNLIIRRAVLHSTSLDPNSENVLDVERLTELENDLSTWSIPPATEALANLIVNNDLITGPVLTTNFDPLILVALKKLSKTPNKMVLHGDGSLDQLHSDRVNIVHMHGDWIKSDTMHTQSQLRLNRPKLKSSLLRVLKNKTLFVIGYGGWDDIFMQALRDLMEDESANFDIIWSFFEHEASGIQSRYEKLINAVQPAIGRNRFRMYGGINCHEFLPKLATYTEKKEQEKPASDIVNVSSEKEHITFRDDSKLTPIWNISTNYSHQCIRELERAEIIDTLHNASTANLVCDWGLSKEEFVESLRNEANSPVYAANLYRIDLEGVCLKSELLEKIELNFGFGLQNFISGMAEDKSLLCLDNYDSTLSEDEKKQLWETINWLVEVVTEFRECCKVIVCSKSPISPKLPYTKLSPLEEFDLRSYITNHPLMDERPDEHVFDILIELAQGIPALVDKHLTELEFLSIDELYESHFSPETHRHDPDSSYPNELIKRVRGLASSEESHSLRSYELLKTLSILENGDSFSNIKKANSQFNFRPSHLKELYSLELIESTTINKGFFKTNSNLGGEKIHFLPPLIRKYVYGQLTTKEIYETVKELANVHLGKKWKNGSLNICSISKSLITQNNKSIGSTHIIIIHLLRCSIEENDSRGINSALRICDAYCSYLSQNDRHRELVKFVEQIRAITKESDKARCSTHIYILEGESLRMIDQKDKAEDILLSAYNQLKKQNYPEKRQLKSVLSSLTLLYDFKKDFKNANKLAQELLDIDNKHVQARYILAITSEHTGINELKELEVELRNNGNTVVANNLAIDLVSRENSLKNKIKWLNNVLQGEDNPYNKFRAANRKGLLLIENEEELDLTPSELRILHTSYLYSFSQKMTLIFNQSHRVLWNYYKKKQNFPVLLNLFQQSSLFWRIYENSQSEGLYSTELGEIINNLLASSFDLSRHKYVTYRVRQLSTGEILIEC